MKATVKYLGLSDEQSKLVNKLGWSGSVAGASYANIKLLPTAEDIVEAERLGLYHDAARGDWTDAEHAWVELQNVGVEWRLLDHIECLTSFPRSCDVGDIIEWEDGRREVVLGIGFAALPAKEKTDGNEPSPGQLAGPASAVPAAR